MKELTRQVLRTLLESDETVTHEQAGQATAILDGSPVADEGRPDPEPYLTLREVGRRLGVSPCSLWRWGVPGHEMGGRRRFRMSEVEQYLASDEMRRRARELREERRTGAPRRLTTPGEGRPMLPTTLDAVKAILKADPTVTPTDRARIVACIRNHGREDCRLLHGGSGSALRATAPRTRDRHHLEGGGFRMCRLTEQSSTSASRPRARPSGKPSGIATSTRTRS